MKKFLLIILLAMAGNFAANAQCAAMFSYNTQTINPPAVFFINQSTGDSTGGGISYFWDFGDGTNDVNPNPIHTYPVVGTYNVCLQMTDNLGCMDTICMPVTITPPPPVISMYFDVDSMSMYACIAPAAVTYYYSFNSQGFSLPDTIFDMHIVWGDGSDTTWTLNGLNMFWQDMPTHSYQNSGTYTASMTITNGLVTATSISQPIIVAASCGSVSGSVYNDLNSNCIFDPGEELQNITVTISNPTGIVGWTQTDILGAYSFNVPTGVIYDVSVQPNNGYYGLHNPTCPTSGMINIPSVPSTGNDFGVSCPQGSDLTGNVTGWRFRPGTTTSVCVFAYNIRCNTPTGTIELTFSGNVTPLPDTAGIGYTVSGQTVTYPFTSPALNWNFCIPVAVSPSAQLGDSVCIDMNIIAPGDSDLSNNTGTFCFEVRNSYDPNDKYTVPAGDGISGAILPNTPLTYTIRFQNTGNDVAYDVYILDTLDANLDVNSLEVIGTSHPMTYSVLTGNILRFTYSNIMLADSNANEPASHGYVTYRINQVSNVANSIEIHNSAAIFFDFNPPIFTNTTLHTIDFFLAVPVSTSPEASFTVFPNPASNNFSIRFSDNMSRKISVTDVVGKEVFHSIANSVITINTNRFANGVYTIHVVDGLNIVTRKLIINHN